MRYGLLRRGRRGIRKHCKKVKAHYFSPRGILFSGRAFPGGQDSCPGIFAWQRFVRRGEATSPRMASLKDLQAASAGWFYNEDAKTVWVKFADRGAAMITVAK